MHKETHYKNDITSVCQKAHMCYIYIYSYTKKVKQSGDLTKSWRKKQ